MSRKLLLISLLVLFQWCACVKIGYILKLCIEVIHKQPSLLVKKDPSCNTHLSHLHAALVIHLLDITLHLILLVIFQVKYLFCFIIFLCALPVL